ncbi:hypothetical protein LSAT2_025010 [Lamellibrachia satsuma]|nr:hypothetical protein LSAT2_025010 [Lamellibrachia satsuma]
MRLDLRKIIRHNLPRFLLRTQQVSVVTGEAFSSSNAVASKSIRSGSHFLVRGLTGSKVMAAPTADVTLVTIPVASVVSDSDRVYDLVMAVIE